MGTREKICRFCLKMNSNFKAVEDLKAVLDTLLPKIDLAAVQEPVMCIYCADMLLKYLDLKVAFCDLQYYTVPFVNKENVKLDLKDVYLNRNENGACIPEDQDVCGFCMGLIKSCSAILLDIEKRNIVLETMIDKCLPELDLSMIKKPVICPPCYGNLENCFHFVTNCFTVERKMKEYCETLDINNKGQIDLSQLLQFTMENARTSEVEDNLFNIIKVENQPSEEIGNDDEREIGNGGQMLCENVKQEVEYKMKSSMDIDDVKLNSEEQFTLGHMVVCKKESSDLGVVEMVDQKCILNEGIDIKTEDPDFVRIEDGVVLEKPEVTTELMLNLEADQSKPYIKQIFTNNNAPTIILYRCGFFPLRTKHKIHLLKHKNPSEVTMYKCDSCSFQTKWNSVFKRHWLVHKNPLEVTKYKCDSCPFETKYKNGIKVHQIVHRSPSEVTMYKCDYCSFQTRYKKNLKGHLLTHKNSSKITTPLHSSHNVTLKYSTECAFR